MDRTTRYVLIAGVLGVSILASGAVGHTGWQAESGTLQMAPGDLPAVPYFPAQYVLDAPVGASEPISTF